MLGMKCAFHFMPFFPFWLCFLPFHPFPFPVSPPFQTLEQNSSYSEHSTFPQLCLLPACPLPLLLTRSVRLWSPGQSDSVGGLTQKLGTHQGILTGLEKGVSSVLTSFPYSMGRSHQLLLSQPEQQEGQPVDVGVHWKRSTHSLKAPCTQAGVVSTALAGLRGEKTGNCVCSPCWLVFLRDPADAVELGSGVAVGGGDMECTVALNYGERSLHFRKVRVQRSLY